MTETTTRYYAQVESNHPDEKGVWNDLNHSLYSQPCTRQGYCDLVDDIEILSHTQERQYRIIKRTTIITEEVVF